MKLPRQRIGSERNEKPVPSVEAREQSLRAVFHVGNPDLGKEEINSDDRKYFWVASETDKQVAELAGWSDMGHRYSFNGRVGCLFLPYAIRSAASVFGGFEGWMGEKDEIIAAMTGYAKSVNQNFGAVDVNMGLDTVAATRGNDRICMVPPHRLVEAGSPEAAEWHDQLRSDMETVLAAEPRRDDLMEQFDNALAFVREGQ